jgi:ribosomal protein L32E
MKKFLRRDARRFAKFGKGRGKKAKWRNPTGRHNKIREKVKGHPAGVNIGYSKAKSEKPIAIFNVRDLERIPKGKIGIIPNIGMRKKIEIAKRAEEMKIRLVNMNAKSFLEKAGRKNKSASKKETVKPEGGKNEK